MLDRLKARFASNPHRHAGIAWEEVEEALSNSPGILRSIEMMEETGGEPDIVGRDDDGALIVCDCSRESPAGRRSLCYDDEALLKRKKNPPKGSAWEQAGAMGVSFLDEAMYRRLQELEAFDLKTSSWIATPPELRGRGGALFCEQRYGRVFVFHNGADSYYSSRGWRGYVRVTPAGAR